MSTNAPKVSSLDADEAERAASIIRPAWEFDDAADAAPPAPVLATAPAPAPASAPVAKANDPVAPLAATKTPAIGTTLDRPSGDIPRDTVIDGAPMVVIGRTIDVGPAPDEAVHAKSDRAPPPAKPQVTRFGLGSDPGPPPSEEPPPVVAPVSPVRSEPPARPRRTPSAPPPEPSAPPPASPVELEPPPRSSRRGPARPVVAAEPPLLQPMGASFSRADDPIEIPVQKSRVGIIVGGLVGLAAIVGAIVYFSGGSPDAKPATPTATATTAAPPPTAAETQATSPQTAKPDAPKPVATATATATATASATPDAPMTATPDKTSPPIAANPPPKPPPHTTPPASPPPHPPPSHGGGGIIHDTPF